MIGSRATYEQAVLFVHGIGSQEQGGTLVRWTDALARWLTDWEARNGQPADKRPPVRVSDVVLHPADGSPAHGELHLGSGDKRVSWLVEEVWWAGDVQTPSYSRLAGFTLRALPITLFGFVGGAIRRHRLAAGSAGFGGRLYHLFWLCVAALVGLPLVLVAAPLIAASVVLLLVVGLLPVPGVRSRVLAVQRALTLTVGDSLILLSSPTQRAAMTSRVIDAIRFAKSRGASRITIVAHSQGAAVVKQALSEHPAFVPRPRLVTVGSGINRLDELESRGKAESWVAPALVAVAAMASWWLWQLEALGEISWAGLAGWAAGYLGVVLLVSGIAVLAPRVPGGSKVLAGALTTILAAFIVAAVVLGGDAVLAAVVSLGVLAVAHEAFQKLLARPGTPESERLPWVEPWLDLYSNADPVPNGPTLTTRPGWPMSIEVANVDSMLADHVRYERERDDALALVAEFALRDTHGPIQVNDEDRELIERARTARRGRLSVLRATRWISVVATIGFLLRWPHDVEAAGRDGHEWAARNIGVPSWLPGTVGDDTAYALGVAGVVVIALAVYTGMARVWRLWNSLESRALFAPPGQPVRDNAGHAALTVLTAGWVLALYATLVLDDWTAFGEDMSAVDWFESVATFVFVVFATALVVAGLIRVRSGRGLLKRADDDSPERTESAESTDSADDDSDEDGHAPNSAIPLQRSSGNGDSSYVTDPFPLPGATSAPGR